MVHPVFDIAADDIASDQWMHCRLIVTLNGSFLQYALLHDMQVLIWKHYQYQSDHAEQTVHHIQNVIETDQVLHQQVKEQTIVYCHPETCLLPERLFNIGINRQYLEMAYGNLHRNLIITEKVSGWDAYNIFRLPHELDAVCRKTFRHASFQHYSSLWLATLKKDQQMHDQMNVVVFEKYMSVYVILDAKLQLAQYYNCEEPLEAVYHLLNICAQLHLSRETLPVHIAGMIRPDDALFTTLAEQFAVLQTDRLPEDLQVPENFRAVPEHFFSPLLKMSRCV